MNLPVYDGTIISGFFTDQNLMSLVDKMGASVNDDNLNKTVVSRQEIRDKTLVT